MLRKAMWKIQDEHQRLQPNSHWFAPSTMRFFRSRLPDFGYLLNDTYYFITSEKLNDRYYTIRSMDKTGEIDTVGEFNALSKTEARRILAHDILKVKVKDL